MNKQTNTNDCILLGDFSIQLTFASMEFHEHFVGKQEHINNQIVFSSKSKSSEQFFWNKIWNFKQLEQGNMAAFGTLHARRWFIYTQQDA